ncbi:uncharacterized protein MONBRDRAFT_34254 [Monosiga brevicollis MX1]|uniref:Sas10 C-terminal domain-containing protein n=1 Tax=Monosiga brevicollis TaxID=81824 RepID=A9VAI1_MONBE|nr:uncharacterized protein MONBRDRAFT_34254 [Monosiga brevicollis MX1]EDQ85544.1 predicted protein [Monosiga brevicollis MX1]|eukprot:XP_001749735.1 hypothetical protein [Monosiga brevicollis MX1]
MPKKRRSKGKYAIDDLAEPKLEVNRGRQVQDAVAGTSDDEIDAFHAAREKVLLGDDDAMPMDSDDDEADHVMGLKVHDVDSADEDDDDDDDVDDAADDDDMDDFDDGINELFLNSFKPEKRKVKTDDLYGDDKTKDDEEMQQSLQGWGRSKDDFYDTNYVDLDYGTDSQDEADAAAEEEEALMLQRRKAQALADDDFVPASLQSKVESLKPARAKTPKKATKARFAAAPAVEEVPRDLESMSVEERTKYLQRTRPELGKLAGLFDVLKSEKTQLLDPLMSHFEDEDAAVARLEALGLPEALVNYVSERSALINAYMATIVSFLVLSRRSREELEHHPVAASLLRLQTVWTEAHEAHEVLLPSLQEALAALDEATDAIDENEEEDEEEEVAEEPAAVFKSRSGTKPVTAKPKRGKLPAPEDIVLSGDSADEGDHDDYYTQMLEDKQLKKLAKTLPQDDGRTDDTAEQRSVTYQIMKNKGLLPARKKEYRNPRVRQRNKFQRAQKRRKGQVQEAVTEVPVYRGETRGIKRTVTKSTKLS